MMDFEDYIAYKGDEIDNAAYNLAVALLRTDSEQSDSQILEWDMSLIAPIIDAAKDVLQEHGKEVCWPYYEGDEVPCTESASCERTGCYITSKQLASANNTNSQYPASGRNMKVYLVFDKYAQDDGTNGTHIEAFATRELALKRYREKVKYDLEEVWKDIGVEPTFEEKEDERWKAYEEGYAAFNFTEIWIEEVELKEE